MGKALEKTFLQRRHSTQCHRLWVPSPKWMPVTVSFTLSGWFFSSRLNLFSHTYALTNTLRGVSSADLLFLKKISTLSTLPWKLEVPWFPWTLNYISQPRMFTTLHPVSLSLHYGLQTLKVVSWGNPRALCLLPISQWWLSQYYENCYFIYFIWLTFGCFWQKCKSSLCYSILNENRNLDFFM